MMRDFFLTSIGLLLMIVQDIVDDDSIVTRVLLLIVWGIQPMFWTKAQRAGIALKHRNEEAANQLRRYCE